MFLPKTIKQREQATTPRSSCKHGGHGAPPPPSSKIMPKHDEDMGSIGKKYWGTTGVSAC